MNVFWHYMTDDDELYKDIDPPHDVGISMDVVQEFA